VIGIGCRKDYDSKKMLNTVKKVLNDLSIHEKSIMAIATVEIKKDEQAIIDLATYFNAELMIHSTQDIKAVESQFEMSEFVKLTIGVGCVAEPCVHLSKAEILHGKQKIEGMTIAIGQTKAD